jgi:hypothetical protein
MIYKIDSREAALRVLVNSARNFTEVKTLVWDLVDESLTITDIPTSIHMCRTSDVTMEYYLYERPSSVRPRGDEDVMELAAEVGMIVRGDTVLYRRGE